MSKSAFDGLADCYGQNRPSYPSSLISEIARSSEAPAKVAVDVGSGTGIATRLLADAVADGWSVVGLEANADMLVSARREETDRGKIQYREGTAEVMPFEEETVGIVMAAQAIHWFDRPRFYAESGRILAPGGCLAILYNDRDLDSPGLLDDFESLMEREMPGYDRYYRTFDQDGELSALEWARENWKRVEQWDLVTDSEGFAGLMLSRSKLKPFAALHGAEGARARLVELANAHARADGGLLIGYTARIHIARK